MMAFIFASAADREIAHLCAGHLTRHGAAVLIALDANESHPSPPSAGEILTPFPRRGRLFGAACAIGIAENMAAHAGAHTVLAKIDADCWLSRDGYAWLAGAGPKARGFPIAGHAWSGIWSAPSSVMFRAAERIARATQCTGCPEAFLFHSYLRRHCGTEASAVTTAQVWRSPRPIPPTTWLATLPSGLPPQIRNTEASELFTHQPPI